ncbi:uncharacterized protein LOC118756298 [Rhagoletis pomonella]|uniref:uncharacterized protein LOC118756298 n=1 Tax=Rhagoletis pomonella TaxID=28610 RepID=UPI0017866181|nr:uncharacterized protein LOC118756298 [Rhagoletis pomonella]
MSLDELKQQRANTKKNITRIKNIVDASLRPGGKTLSAAEYKCRLGIFESYFKQVLSIQTDIEKLDPDDGGRADLEELYVTTKLTIQAQLVEDHNISLPETSCIVQHSTKLPKLKLPTFSGKYSEYQNFITSFKQIIDKEFSLSNIEKFNHLRNSLQGQALETVDAFQVTNENYPKALERLKERTSAIYGSLLSLGNEMQISQAMLIYLVLQKSDEQTNKKWKESLDFKTLPTWGDCVKVLERHCQYLESMEASHTGSAVIPGNSKAALSKVRNQPKGYSFTCSNTPCSVCSSTNHKISNCDRFKSYNIIQRFDQAKKMGLCINCLSKGHQMAQCPSTHRCKVCSKQHHSLLHRGSTSAQQTTNPPPSREAAVHTHMHNSSSDNVILATAMILVRDSSGDYRLGKALLDSCSQVNFITEEFAQRLSLPKGKQNIEIQGIANDSLDAKLEKLWRIEEVAVNAEPWTREQTTCEQMYRTTVSRNPAGRIVVKLPFKDDPSCLGDSYTTALRRFNAQERRLAKLPHLRKQYVDFMDEYERLGHMSIMENPNLGEPHYYIPHHCVLKPTSTTTKLRVVFDASCRTTTQISLNEIQMVGPTIQNSQVVLHWLKMHSITLSAFVGNRVSEIQDLTTGAHWRAPHFGGIWEAAVKSAKGHLNRSMANSRLTYEELTTALVEIEAVMNSRPITPLSSDPNDYEALTPGHFIIGDALKALPERNVSSNISHAQQWAQIATIKQNFWKQWSHEYINELQVRSKWFADRPNIENNTMVIIHEDNLPPQKWLMGRIVNCIPGKDSKIRVVDVRTSKGIIRRPIHKLAVLPV